MFHVHELSMHVYLKFLEVDKCVKNPQVCHSNGKCAYRNGSYVCQCTHGYIGDGKNNCTGMLISPNASTFLVK